MEIPEVIESEGSIIDYKSIVARHSFKENCALKFYLKQRIPCLFPDGIVKFSICRVIAALHAIIINEQLFDPQNPKIIWCNGNELGLIFKVTAMFFSDLPFELLKVLDTSESYCEFAVAFYPKDVGMRMASIVRALGPQSPTWGSLDAFSLKAEDDKKKIKPTDVCAVSMELSAFLQSIVHKSQFQDKCYSCLYQIIHGHLTCLPSIPILSKPFRLHFPRFLLSRAFGGIRAFTTDQIPFLLKYNLRVRDDVAHCSNGPHTFIFGLS